MHPNANTMSTNELNMDETEQIETNGCGSIIITAPEYRSGFYILFLVGMYMKPLVGKDQWRHLAYEKLINLLAMDRWCCGDIQNWPLQQHTWVMYKLVNVSCADIEVPVNLVQDIWNFWQS